MKELSIRKHSFGPDLQSGPEGQERDLESRFLVFGTFRDHRSLFWPFREGLQIPPEQGPVKGEGTPSPLAGEGRDEGEGLTKSEQLFVPFDRAPAAC